MEIKRTKVERIQNRYEQIIRIKLENIKLIREKIQRDKLSSRVWI